MGEEGTHVRNFLYYLFIIIKELVITFLVNQTPKFGIILVFSFLLYPSLSSKSIFKLFLNFHSSTRAFVLMPVVICLQHLNIHLTSIINSGLFLPNQSYVFLKV